MIRPLAIALLLAGCASQAGSQDVTALMAGYTLAASGVAAYAAQPGSNPVTVAAVRRCENTAWQVVKPVSDALIAKQSPAPALVAAGMTSLGELNTCLTTWGVKP